MRIKRTFKAGKAKIEFRFSVFPDRLWFTLSLWPKQDANIGFDLQLEHSEKTKLYLDACLIVVRNSKLYRGWCEQFGERNIQNKILYRTGLASDDIDQYSYPELISFMFYTIATNDRLSIDDACMLLGSQYDAAKTKARLTDEEFVPSKFLADIAKKLKKWPGQVNSNVQV